MKVKENIYVLELPNINPKTGDNIYLTLIKNNKNLTLIDSGFPGQIDFLKSAIEKDNFRLEDIDTLILTHHDVDHIGNVKKMLNLIPNLKIISLDKEADYLNGNKTPCKIETMEKNLDNMGEKEIKFYQMFKSFFSKNKIEVDEVVKDGDVIQNCQDIKVIATPGHTVGHMSLYIEKHKLLIAGDLLMVEDGKAVNCDKSLNYDNDIYLESLNKIKDLDIHTAICYHGGVVSL